MTDKPTMNKRRITWLIYNVSVTPFIPIRAVLFLFYKIGAAAEWIGLRTPGWRLYSGWGYEQEGEGQ